MRIRKFELSDLPQSLAIIQKYANWDVTLTEADLTRFSSSNPELFLVAEHEDQILGLVYAEDSRLPDEALGRRGASKAASIEILAVPVEHRKKGIGTKLMSSILEILKNHHVDYVSLSVPIQETAAKNLYEKLGFETRALFMSKRLK